jgi:type I restriction enzyme R subunit
MYAYDLFDVLAQAAYRQRPLTRAERARTFEADNDGWLAGMPADAAATIRAVLAAFTAGGTRALENSELWELPAVRAAGGFAALDAYDAAVFNEAKTRVFAL